MADPQGDFSFASLAVNVFPGAHFHTEFVDNATMTCLLFDEKAWSKQLYILTAGHCIKTEKVNERAYLKVRDRREALISEYAFHGAQGVGSDVGLIELFADKAVNLVECNFRIGGIASGAKITDIKTASEVDDQNAEDVRIYGCLSKEVGAASSTMRDKFFTTSGKTQRGDSGGPAYIINESGDASLVGVFGGYAGDSRGASINAALAACNRFLGSFSIMGPDLRLATWGNQDEWRQ